MRFEIRGRATSGARLVAIALALAMGAHGQQTELDLLMADDAEQGAFFGSALDVDGRWAIVGSDGEQVTGGPDSGAAYLFRRQGAAWVQVQKLKAWGPDKWDQFGSSVALCGTTAIVGAPYADAPGLQNYGFAYVYELQAGALVYKKTLKPDDLGPSVQQRIGTSVALSGDTAIFGDDQVSHEGEAAAGCVYVFERRSGKWSGPVRLHAPNPVSQGLFGSAVDIRGDTAVIGARGDDTALNGAGAVHVFRRAGGAWSSTATLTAGDPHVVSSFGGAVSFDRDRILVGDASWRNGGLESQGAAYVFVERQGEWFQEAVLLASDGAQYDLFGTSVHLEGDRAIVGAAGSIATPTGGAAYVFERAGSDWVQVDKLVPSAGGEDPGFGGAVRLAHGTALVSSVRFDDNRGAIFEYGTAAESTGTPTTLSASLRHALALAAHLGTLASTAARFVGR